MSHQKIRILCVDDHAFVVEGFRARVDHESDMEVVGHLESADNLLPTVSRTAADIVLMDVDMPGCDPFAAMRELHRMRPGVRAIVLSAFVRDHYVQEAYRSGAWGYITKNATPDEVINGIRAVRQGRTTFSTEVQNRTSFAPAAGRTPPRPEGARLDLLSDREMEVLKMIARGMSRTSIASQLSRSVMTVDNHRKSIMKKLGLHDRADLVRYAIAEKLVEV